MEKNVHPGSISINDYNYVLPEEKIAKFPLEQRDASKLLVYHNGMISENVFHNIASCIPTGSMVVFNNTRVVHARLLFVKPTGSTIEIFCLEPGNKYPDIVSAMTQTGEVIWECMIGGASKWKPGTILQMHCHQPDFTLSASIISRNTDAYSVKLSWERNDLSFAEVLHFCGKVPLPPYIKRDVTADDEERYQPVFARYDGSVAAPTASLHFTAQTLQSLQEHKISQAYLTLHVGAGTFKPVKAATMTDHDMHAEWMEINRDTLQQLYHQAGKGIVACGTTTLRTLESIYWIGNKVYQGKNIDFSGIAVEQFEPYETREQCSLTEAITSLVEHIDRKHITKLITRTRILIAPGYQFKIVNQLITNFHQPKSSLLLLVAAFVKDDWHNIYNYALAHDYRFLSYGDASLLTINT